MVIVALNMGSSSVGQPIRIQNIPGTITAMTPYVTSRTKNCEQQSALTVTAGSFVATLADSSITTFVGDVVSDVEEGTTIPHSFQLFQNYPNPFNPSTTIRFEIASTAHVTLTIHDVLGRMVANLVDGVHEPNRYTVRWSPSGLGSGIYLVRIAARGRDGFVNFVSTTKVVFIK